MEELPTIRPDEYLPSDGCLRSWWTTDPLAPMSTSVDWVSSGFDYSVA